MNIKLKQALKGQTILVTRPEHQEQTLCKLIKESDGKFIHFPTIKITDIDKPEKIVELNTLIDKLDEFDMAIFISPNAVNKGVPLVRSKRPFPKHLKLAAVGASSAQALDTLKLSPVIHPQDTFNSEALLLLDELNEVKNKNIIIFRGNGGKAILGETLQNRGANIHYAEVYQRIKPDILDRTKQKLIDALETQMLNWITATSPYGLQNLSEMTKVLDQAEQKQLLNTPLLVISENMVTQAQKIGFKNTILLAPNASDHQIVDTIILNN